MSLHFLPTSTGLAIQGIPGIAEGLVEGPSPLVNALISATAVPPESCYSQPLGISLRSMRPGLPIYPLWAFWLRPNQIWEPGFAPLQSWRTQLPSTHRGSPLLVLAKAQGRWSGDEAFSTELSRILHERDPLGAPDGRMLVHAAFPSMPLRNSLFQAIQCFLASMQPSSQEFLPENTMLVRSGWSSANWDLPFPAAVLVRASRRGLTAQHPDPPLFRISIPHGLRVQTNWKGPLVWGAWRGDRRQERFLTLGRWAGSAIRGGVQVQLHKESQSKAQFHGSLSRVSGGANVTRVKSDQLLARSVRNIARELADDYKLTLAMETPYAELLRVAAPQEITLFEAASKPEAEPLDPLSVSVLDGGPLSEIQYPPEGLCAELQQRREVQMVFAESRISLGKGSFAALHPPARIPDTQRRGDKRHRGRMNAA